MNDLKWYHYAGASLLAWWLWKREEERDAMIATLANQAAAAGTGPTQEDVDAEHRAAVAAREQIAKLDAALSAQRDIAAETVGAVSGTVRAVLPPTVNAPPRLVMNAPAAVENERTLATNANAGNDFRVVPKEGQLSIVADATYAQAPTGSTLLAAQAIPTKKASLVAPAYLDELRNLR